MECNIVIIAALLGITMAQDYFEERHKYQIRTEYEHLKEIPSHFEIKGPHSLPKFKKYINDIEKLANKVNKTMIYKVNVDTESKIHKTKKGKHKNMKKYNVPLKKKNLRLSSFEAELRKHVNDNHKLRMISENMKVTTDKKVLIHTTKQVGAGKYKPVINAVKSKYVKNVKPVRTKVITLTK